MRQETYLPRANSSMAEAAHAGTWRVLRDFKGKYQVLVDIDLGPFEAIQDKTWHLID